MPAGNSAASRQIRPAMLMAGTLTSNAALSSEVTMTSNWVSPCTCGVTMMLSNGETGELSSIVSRTSTGPFGR